MYINVRQSRPGKGIWPVFKTRDKQGTFHNNKGSIPQDIMTKLQII